MQFTRSQQKFLFLFFISAIYLALFVWLDFLNAPHYFDERSYWKTIVSFSDTLLPTLDDIRDYEQLTTPLIFIIFSFLEDLFGRGIAASRLFNMILSLAMVFIIGWPTKEKGGRGMLCLIGLFLCPYYLFLSGRIYTEMVACFWVVMGLMGYIRGRHFWSAIAFVLAISTRQYMLAFPAAVATYEFMVALMGARQTSRIQWQDQWRWIAPLLAACSIFGWFYLFQGMVPQSGFEARGTPEVQQTTWGLDPGVAICFLGFVGLYIVIPEFLLFEPLAKLRSMKQQWPQQKYRIAAIVIGLLVFILVFPPPTYGAGNLVKLARVMPHEVLRISLYYFLALLACLRFIKPNLIGLIILFNTLIMMKAYPWDRYVLPLAVAFWYLKSEGVVDQFPILARRSAIDSKPVELSTTESS